VKYTARQPRKSHNVSPVSPIRELLTLLGGLVAGMVAVYVLLGLGADLLAQRISPQTEQRLASFFAPKNHAEQDQSQEEQWLQSLVDRMWKKGCVQLPYPITIQVSQSKKVNAMALPGGRIVVFSGLLHRVQSENEMAFILAHELGHFKHRDHLRGLGRGLVFAVLSTLMGGSDGAVAGLVHKSVQVSELSFSRDQESAADSFALDVLNCIYGHVSGATDFFTHMPNKQDPGALGHYFSSHPENQRRIKALVELQRKKHYREGKRLPLPFNNTPKSASSQ
jgi:Zn-dependent protease with chaperone function